MGESLAKSLQVVCFKVQFFDHVGRGGGNICRGVEFLMKQNLASFFPHRVLCGEDEASLEEWFQVQVFITIHHRFACMTLECADESIQDLYDDIVKAKELCQENYEFEQLLADLSATL